MSSRADAFSASCVIIVAAMILRRLWFTAERYPRLDKTLWSRELVSYSVSCLGFFCIYTLAVLVICGAEISWLIAVVALATGIVLFSYFLVSTMIPRAKHELVDGVNRAWRPIFGLGVCGFVLMIAARVIDFPEAPGGVRWSGLVYGPYALGAAIYSIYFRRELSRMKALLGVLPLCAPVILGLALRSMK